MLSFAIKLIMVLAASLALWKLRTIRRSFPRMITLILLLSVVVSLLPGDALFLAGMDIYAFALVATVIYCVVAKHISTVSRAMLAVSAVLLLLKLVFILMHLPAAGLLSLLMVIPLFLCTYLFFRRKENLSNEKGMLLILGADALCNVVNVVLSIF